MSQKKYALDNQIEVTIYKRKSSRQIKLSISGDGQVRVSIPPYVPYSAAIKFAESKIDWIKTRLPEPTLLNQGRAIGKNHQLIFKPSKSNKISTRLSDLEATVFYPKNLKIQDQAVQAAAKRIILKALRSQSLKLLPIRLDQLAKKYGYEYSSVKIKSLKTRWGSCDSHQNITLNLYLMDLPWDLIDYVLLHELNHTVVMQHGPKFWQTLELKVPDHQALRKRLKNFKTTL